MSLKIGLFNFWKKLSPFNFLTIQLKQILEPVFVRAFLDRGKVLPEFCKVLNCNLTEIAP